MGLLTHLKKFYCSLRIVFPPIEVVVRLLMSVFYKKENFQYANSEDSFDDIYKNNYWKDSESVSGGGSTVEATKSTRDFLIKFFTDFNINSMLDIPCGDFNWMRLVLANENAKKIKYIGGDVVKQMIDFNNDKYSSDNISFEVLDLTNSNLPTTDVIFCKDCLQHLSYEKVWEAINNITKSGAKYLLVTTYPKTLRNWDILDGDYRPLNLRKPPFSFTEPILSFKEKYSKDESDKTMILYDLSKTKLSEACLQSNFNDKH